MNSFTYSNPFPADKYMLSCPLSFTWQTICSEIDQNSAGGGRDREVQRFCSWEEGNLGGREGAISESCLYCLRHA